MNLCLPSPRCCSPVALAAFILLASCAPSPTAEPATQPVAEAPTATLVAATATTPSSPTITPEQTNTPVATETPTLAPTVGPTDAAVGTATATEAAADATATPQAGNPLFDGEGALAFAEAQCEIGPRPTGSEALLRTRDFIKQQLEPQGWTLIEQDFTYQEVPIHNLLAIKGEGEPLMVGAHFDTRPRADRDQQFPDQPIIGGNDGASGVAVLLELGRTLEVPEGRQVQLAFFDAEDRGNIDGWPFSVGAGHMASNLVGPRPAAVVVVDMIGDADQQIYREQNSDDALNDVIFGIAAELGYEGQGFYNSERWTIIDDHLPFIEQGIPAIDLIDFDYPAWHTLADTCEQLGAASLERVGRVLEVWLERPVGESYLPVVLVSENTVQTD